MQCTGWEALGEKALQKGTVKLNASYQCPLEAKKKVVQKM